MLCLQVFQGTSDTQAVILNFLSSARTNLYDSPLLLYKKCQIESLDTTIFKLNFNIT